MSKNAAPALADPIMHRPTAVSGPAESDALIVKTYAMSAPTMLLMGWSRSVLALPRTRAGRGRPPGLCNASGSA